MVIKGYKFGFETLGLVLFLGIMLPNFIWFTVFQAVMIAALCLLKRTDCPKLKLSPLIVGVIVCVLAYWAGWILYYNGIVGAVVVLMLTVPPCAAFLLFALDRRNYIAAVPACGFTACHLIYGVVNFIV